MAIGSNRVEEMIGLDQELAAAALESLLAAVALESLLAALLVSPFVVFQESSHAAIDFSSPAVDSMAGNREH